jgi:glutamate/tyrosine decarboxylase-like PLP-dependent enzyme
VDHNPEFSRRARGFVNYAALRFRGASGVRDLVDRACDLAQSFARRLADDPALTVLNEVALNQVLVGFTDPYEVAERVRREGTCFMTATRWNGRPVLRLSVSNWSTDELVDRRVGYRQMCHG